MKQPTPRQPIGLRRANHVGIVVADLDVSLAFYEALTGVRAAPADSIGGPRMAGVLGLKEASIRYATIHLDNLNIDLLQYDLPSAEIARYAGNQISAMHLCFEVEDLAEVIGRMTVAGMVFQGEPITFEAADGLKAGAGTAVAYFDDPDRTHLELIQPAGPFRRKTTGAAR